MLIDSTLREGEQLYGAYFTDPARRRLVMVLAAAGVEEIELGCVGQEHLPGLAAWAAGRGLGTALSAWCPGREDSLRQAATLGLDRINIGVPVSHRHLSTRLGWSPGELLRRLEELLSTAANLGGAELSVGFEDATGADPGFLAQAARRVARAGATRIRLSDTRGLATPGEMASLVRGVARAVDVPLAVHCHNDFGMATANAVAGLDAGSAWADCSLLGIGERSGIAATEELAAFLVCRQNADYELAPLVEACELTARQAGVPIPRNKPVLGSDIFRCETGLHVHALELDPELYEPYAPRLVGRKRELSLGAKSGRAAVLGALQDLGIPAPPDGGAGLTRRVRRRARDLGRPLRQEELLALARQAPSHEQAPMSPGRAVPLALLACLLLLLLPVDSALAEKLRVACAANFTAPMRTLATIYEKRAGCEVVPVFGSTGMLYGQITQGAPFDLFLAADEKRPGLLHEAGRAEAPRVYARGRAALWTALDLEAADWRAALAVPRVERVALANPETAPYGRAAVQALRAAGLYAKIEHRLVYGLNVGQTFQFAHSRAVEAAFVALSQTRAPAAAAGRFWPVPEAGTVSQAACVLSHGNAPAARRFLRFLLDAQQARDVLTEYGYR